jgi:hypothetical protein
MLVLQKVGNNIQLGLHMFLYKIFCLPLVLACLYNPMMFRRRLSVLSHRKNEQYSFNIEWYYIFIRILDNAMMLLPLCLLHITNPRSTYAFVSKRRKLSYMKSYKTSTSKSKNTLPALSWYYVLPVLISSCIICVSSAFANTGRSTKGTHHFSRAVRVQ